VKTTGPAEANLQIKFPPEISRIYKVVIRRMSHRTSIPVVDLFAGAGGLGEGFSSIRDGFGNRVFDVRVSIEKDQKAVETLELRTLFRNFPPRDIPECYYDYLRGEISKSELISHVSIREAWKRAQGEVHQATLGETPCELIDQWIGEAIGSEDTWVLIGGPPCQAYSTVGRSRMRRSDPLAFEKDERHFLYKQYLRIIRKFKPAVFVMENVKGLLSSTHAGSVIFQKIFWDLSHPEQGLEYDIRSFVREPELSKPLKPNDFIIEAEKYSIPQRRHRVILFGVRQDHGYKPHDLLIERDNLVSVQEVLSSIPRIRSKLSHKAGARDSFDAWLKVLKDAPKSLAGWKHPNRLTIEQAMNDTFPKARYLDNTGSRFVETSECTDGNISCEMSAHLSDGRLGGVCQHESRSHMPSDLHRYLFASCYAQIHGVSPKLAQYPLNLWPEHKNLNAMEVPFDDRFKVQCWKSPSTTVMSHMAKDGHYFIHPDPSQCRSMTVREAARLQTFPDNYFFEGNKIHQYTQVGNAVPPYLAKQLAEIVSDFLTKTTGYNSGMNPAFLRTTIQEEELMESP